MVGVLVMVVLGLDFNGIDHDVLLSLVSTVKVESRVLVQ